MTTDPIKALEEAGEAVISLAFKMPPPNEWTPQFVQLGQEMVRRAQALKPLADVVMDDPFPIFSDRLRVRREECDEAEVNFDDSDILALAMDVLSGVGWNAPPASPATPERILELEDKLERLGASLQLISCNGHLSGSYLADIARIALKSKEPSPSSVMENEHGK